MRVDHQQQRGVGAFAANPGFLGATVEQHAHAAIVRIVPVLGVHFSAVRRQPGHVLDPDVFVVITHQKAPAAQDRISQA
ncbi:hypothetical protein D9M72_598900 [compost metagenome]